VFWSVTLPLAWRSVLAGAVLAFCRALGEFGITLMVAGTFRPDADAALAIYDRCKRTRWPTPTRWLCGRRHRVVLLFGLSRLARCGTER